MLYANSGAAPRTELTPQPHGTPDHPPVWLDLMQGPDAERSMAEKMTGLRVPSFHDLSEIESSSRLATEDGALYLSTSMHYRDKRGLSHMAPVGFVLNKDVLLTVRFAAAPVFEIYAERFNAERTPPCSMAAFLGLLEAMVDRMADVLEHVGSELESISHRVFRTEDSTSPAKTDAQLRATLRTVGREGERLSNLRDSLLGIQRIVLYTTEAGASWLTPELKPRLKTLKSDIASLTDYDVQMSNKVQFLLDATLGFINIEQNNGIKVLTVVSVVGVPPTLVASMYGMNFKNMPELEWHYGYPYALTLIVLSALLPLWWFKKKGWI